MAEKKAGKNDKKMARTWIKDIDAAMDGKEVLVRGWAADVRDLAKIKFVLLRDMTGKVQAVALKSDLDDETFKQIGKIHPESVVEIEGVVKANKEAKLGYELSIKKCNVMSMAAVPLPIDPSPKSQTMLDKRLDYRFMDLRRDKTHAIFNIQSCISMSFREFFRNNGFIEIQPPSIIATATEGGTELYPVKYFEKDAYLAQSPQLYKQMCAISLERVFTITPVWRAEKHNTIRHLNESRQMDIEVAFADEFEVMKLLEGAVKFIVSNVLKTCKKEIEAIGVNLKIPESVYITYKDTITLLKKHGIKIEQGDDITPEAEKKLDELYPDSIVFVHSWPREIKPFYIWPKEDGTSAGFDAIYKGIEISSGGQRVHVPEILIQQLKDKGLNPEQFEYYISSFRYGAPYHSGWSIGLERLTMMIVGADNIRETALFPRDRDRLKP
jgi:nondiscriminating aspartyl-tRNA synthetase